MNSFYTFLLSLFVAVSANAQNYSTTFNADDTDGWEEFSLGAESNPLYAWTIWNGVLRHAYPVGGMEYTDDWMVSPVFNFSNGANIDSISYSFGGFGTPMGADTIALYLIVGDKNPAMATSKQLLRLYTDENYTNDNMVRVDTDIAIPAVDGEAYLAFKYRTIVNWLDANFYDLSISGLVNTQEVQLPNTMAKVYPNPSNAMVNIEIDNSLTIQKIEMYNNTGALVNSYSTSTFSVANYTAGLYFVKIVTDHGVVTQSLVVR